MGKKQNNEEKAEKVDLKKGQLFNPEELENEVLTSSAQFWNFEENPVFYGIPTGRVIHDKEEVDEEGKPRLAGYVFIDAYGEEHIIGAAHKITEAINTPIQGLNYALPVDAKAVLKIEFIEKIQLEKGGRSFNRFKVTALFKKDEQSN